MGRPRLCGGCSPSSAAPWCRALASAQGGGGSATQENVITSRSCGGGGATSQGMPGPLEARKGEGMNSLPCNLQQEPALPTARMITGQALKPGDSLGSPRKGQEFPGRGFPFLAMPPGFSPCSLFCRPYWLPQALDSVVPSSVSHLWLLFLLPTPILFFPSAKHQPGGLIFPA